MADPLTWETYCEWRHTKCPQRDLSEPMQRDEEITQATLELVGEVAEVNLLSLEYGNLLLCEPHRSKLIDECGDCLFCACWVATAWNNEPPFNGGIPEKGEKSCEIYIEESIAKVSYYSGILANRLKKQRYQGKKQNKSEMARLSEFAIMHITDILEQVGSSVDETLRVNIAKLNKRFPRGHTPDGGIRE